MLVSSGKFYCGSKSKERKGLMFPSQTAHCCVGLAIILFCLLRQVNLQAETYSFPYLELDQV